LVCDECKEEFFDSRVTGKFSSFLAKEGSDSWFVRGVEDFLRRAWFVRYAEKGNHFLRRGYPDVWFDSGVSHQAVLKKRKELGGCPASFI